MDIVIKFLKPSKFYINVDVSSKESMTCHEHIWQSGRSEVAAVYGNVHYRSAKKNYASRVGLATRLLLHKLS